MTIQEVRFDVHIRKGDKDVGGKFNRNTRSQRRVQEGKYHQQKKTMKIERQGLGSINKRR